MAVENRIHRPNVQVIALRSTRLIDETSFGFLLSRVLPERHGHGRHVVCGRGCGRRAQRHRRRPPLPFRGLGFRLPVRNAGDDARLGGACMLRVVEVGVRRPFAGSHRATLRRNRATVAVRGEACALGLFAFHLCECRLKQTLGLPELAVRPVRICHVSNAFSVDCFVYMPAIPVFYCCWAMNFAYSPADSRSGSSSSSSILTIHPSPYGSSLMTAPSSSVSLFT